VSGFPGGGNRRLLNSSTLSKEAAVFDCNVVAALLTS
jgi:hypothetical protein